MTLKNQNKPEYSSILALIFDDTHPSRIPMCEAFLNFRNYFIWRYSDHPDLFAKVFRIPLWGPMAKFVRYNMQKGVSIKGFFNNKALKLDVIK